MTDAERELMDLALTFARAAREQLVLADSEAINQKAADVLDACTNLLREREGMYSAPLPPPMRRMPVAGEILPPEQRATPFRKCLACVVEPPFQAEHTCELAQKRRAS